MTDADLEAHIAALKQNIQTGRFDKVGGNSYAIYRNGVRSPPKPWQATDQLGISGARIGVRAKQALRTAEAARNKRKTKAQLKLV